jgi:prepilin-type N-terminal cleavage/methylation domain-containing protein
MDTRLQRQKNRSGFTMLETMIVLVILSLIAAMGLPRIDSFKYKADASAVQIRSLLMQAQVFERIRIQALPEGNLFARPATPLSTPGMNDYGAIRAENIKMVSGYPSVIFRRDGSVSSPLELYSTSARKRNTDFRVTTVVQATGRTDFLRFTGTNWKKPQ